LCILDGRASSFGSGGVEYESMKASSLPELEAEISKTLTLRTYETRSRVLE
jgi:hypothetical protein